MLLNKIIFAEKLWLWGLLIIPLAVIIFKLYQKRQAKKQLLTNFADPELLPHLIHQDSKQSSATKLLTLWCLLWLLTIIALANPRWKFVDYESYKPASALVVVLDLSSTMQAEDIKPTRLMRAKQQIQDIIQIGQGLRIGLIAFAAYPHLVTPITDDLATIAYLLPALDSDLISKQGKDLNAALLAAQKLLQAEPGNNKHILLISDGDMENNFLATIKDLQKNKVVVHTAAVGTETGAPFKDNSGALARKNGQVQISKLNSKLLSSMVQDSHGKYWHISYADTDTKALVKMILAHNSGKDSVSNTNIRQWEEGFFWILIPLFVFTFLYRRQQMQLMLLLTCFGWFGLPRPVCAFELLQNNSQQGATYFNNGDYEAAVSKFTDPYHKGVAFYKSGKFAEAEAEFKNSTRPEVKIQTKYNLGNAQLKQHKYQAAIDTYQELIAEVKNHKQASDNLAIAKKLLAHQPEQDKSKSDCNCKDKKNSANNKEQQQENNSAAKNSANAEGKSKSSDNAEEERKPSENSNDESKQNMTQQTKQQDLQPKNSKTESKPEAETGDKPVDSAAKRNASPESTNKDTTSASAAEVAPETKAKEDKEDPETEVWLQRMNSDVKVFMKNKFLIEERNAN